MESPEKGLEKEREDLERKLASAGNLYEKSRYYLMLAQRGGSAAPSEEELQAMKEALGSAREGKAEYLSDLPAGYELARWLMILSKLGEEPVIEESDHRLIEEAEQEFAKKKNYHQLASLWHTLEVIGIEPSKLSLPQEAQEEIDKYKAELS